MIGVYTRVCIYYRQIVVLPYLNSIVYDWLNHNAMRTVQFRRVDRCKIHAVHKLFGI